MIRMLVLLITGLLCHAKICFKFEDGRFGRCVILFISCSYLISLKFVVRIKFAPYHSAIISISALKVSSYSDN